MLAQQSLWCFARCIIDGDGEQELHAAHEHDIAKHCHMKAKRARNITLGAQRIAGLVKRFGLSVVCFTRPRWMGVE